MDTESIVLEKVRDAYKTFIGYPLNLGYDYTPVFDKFKYAMNNIGCPFSRSTLKISSKEIELKVLDFFADLWGICKTNIWGYLTSSGTEGNFQGLYVGREVLGNVPVFYTSKESHYSIFKIARLLQLELCVIDTLESGEMDYRDFEHKLMQNINRPALINANLGTTMKSAIDNTREIYRVLKKHNKHHEYYLHADGALMGFVLPFLENDFSRITSIAYQYQDISSWAYHIHVEFS